MAAGQGGGYRGRAWWEEARHIVRGGPVGVAGKRRVRWRGFEAGHALGKRPLRSVRSRSPQLGVRRPSAIKPTSSPLASAAMSVSNAWDS